MAGMIEIQYWKYTFLLISPYIAREKMNEKSPLKLDFQNENLNKQGKQSTMVENKKRER